MCSFFLFCPLCTTCFLDAFWWINNLHSSHTITYHIGQKASFSSYQQIYFGHVQALPHCLALVCFCDSEIQRDQSFYYLCAWFKGAASGWVNEGAGLVKGFAMNQAFTTAYCSLKETAANVTKEPSLSFFLCSCFVLLASPLFCAFPFPEHSGKNVFSCHMAANKML